MTEVRTGRPGWVFLSYRRQDTEFPAAWLYQRLVDAGCWDKAIEHLSAVTEINPDYRDVIAKLEQAQADQSRQACV